jgi:hypothetical protein
MCDELFVNPDLFSEKQNICSVILSLVRLDKANEQNETCWYFQESANFHFENQRFS